MYYYWCVVNMAWWDRIGGPDACLMNSIIMITITRYFSNNDSRQLDIMQSLNSQKQSPNDLTTRKATRPPRGGGAETTPPPDLKSIFGVIWPWPLTSWPKKFIVSSTCPVERLCQFAAKLVHSFSRYSFHKTGNGPTDSIQYSSV